ncbi:MAG: VIT domain-containing protein, partial [Kofleriaceae bacterium]
MPRRSYASMVLIGVVCASCGSRPSFRYRAPPWPGDARVGLGSQGAADVLRSTYRAYAERPAPPVSLVPTDGSELALRALDARVSIEGPLAHTELRFRFRNTEPRVREGRFTLTLPDGAAVGRFAMKIDGAWREARVVSREQGRRVYETFL